MAISKRKQHPKNKLKIHHKKKIKFHILEYISKFSNRGIRVIEYDKTCSECNKLNSDVEKWKIYTNKVLAFIEETIYKFIKYYYIPEIEKIAFHLAHIQIIGKDKCGVTIKDAMKSHHPQKEIRVRKQYTEK